MTPLRIIASIVALAVIVGVGIRAGRRHERREAIGRERGRRDFRCHDCPYTGDVDCGKCDVDERETRRVT